MSAKKKTPPPPVRKTRGPKPKSATDPRGSVLTPMRYLVTAVEITGSRPLVTVHVPYVDKPKIPKGAIVRVIQSADATDADVRAVEKAASDAERVDVQPRPRANAAPELVVRTLSGVTSARAAVNALVEQQPEEIREALGLQVASIMNEVGL